MGTPEISSKSIPTPLRNLEVKVTTSSASGVDAELKNIEKTAPHIYSYQHNTCPTSAEYCFAGRHSV